MNMNQFLDEVVNNIVQLYGDEYSVEIQNVMKTNHMIRKALVIREQDKRIAPSIYMEEFYEEYLEGMDVEEIVDSIIRIYKQNAPQQELDMEFFLIFDEVKERICYKLINRECNEELLMDVPYIEYLDFAVCFYYSFTDCVLGNGAILIHNCHMKQWNVDVEELYRCACENTPRIYPYQLMSMEEMAQQLKERARGQNALGHKDNNVFDYQGHLGMKVLTNAHDTFGAVCILYKDLLRQIAKQCNEDFYIIPCSVHEVILFSPVTLDTPDHLKNIIDEVNRTMLSQDEYLSDNLYLYDKEKDCVSIL